MHHKQCRLRYSTYVVKCADVAGCVSAHDVAQREELPGEIAPGVGELPQVPRKLCMQEM